jgi:hypothetical protein
LALDVVLLRPKQLQPVGSEGGFSNHSQASSQAANNNKDDDGLGEAPTTRSRSLLQRGGLLPEIMNGVVMRRPNYTAPACLLARREGPWRPGGDTTTATAEHRPRRILVLGMQSSGVKSLCMLLPIGISFVCIPHPLNPSSPVSF